MRLLLLVVAWHYQLAYLLAERSPQERNDLGAGTAIVRSEHPIVNAVGDAVLHGPGHRVCIVAVGEHIAELGLAVDQLANGPEQEGHALAAGAGRVGAELAAAGTGGNALAQRPADSFAVVRVLGNICHVHSVVHHRRSSRTPQESDNLTSGAWLVRSKQAVAHAAGDAVLRRPLDGLEVIGIVRHVIEEVENAVVLHKGHLDLHLARRHGECVFPIALVGELEIIAVLVGDGNGFQHIAAVWFHRDCHGAAR